MRHANANGQTGSLACIAPRIKHKHELILASTINNSINYFRCSFVFSFFLSLFTLQSRRVFFLLITSLLGFNALKLTRIVGSVFQVVEKSHIYCCSMLMNCLCHCISQINHRFIRYLMADEAKNAIREEKLMTTMARRTNNQKKK